MKKNLNILVYGGGAVGSYFAGMMSHNGQNVTLITRGDHLKKIKNPYNMIIFYICCIFTTLMVVGK